ncbi:MAG: hypothetical protein Q7T59_01650, partial [Candidatus Woesebacteria bacterium]|nr:hypothetical protein [Candidatus Woesebacteria bacterium]
MTIENGSGWKDEGDGFYSAPRVDINETSDFSEFAAGSRSRWDFVEFLKHKIQNLLTKQNPKKE